MTAPQMKRHVAFENILLASIFLRQPMPRCRGARRAANRSLGGFGRRNSDSVSCGAQCPCPEQSKLRQFRFSRQQLPDWRLLADSSTHRHSGQPGMARDFGQSARPHCSSSPWSRPSLPAPRHSWPRSHRFDINRICQPHQQDCLVSGGVIAKPAYIRQALPAEVWPGALRTSRRRLRRIATILEPHGYPLRG